MDTYLGWLIQNTRTKWWHDSAEPGELAAGLGHGAVGVTTNPYLSNLALTRCRKVWGEEIDAVLARQLKAEAKAEELMRLAVTRTAEKLLPQFERTRGRMGFVCAQVNPARACDREAMWAMAQRFHAWAPNITVKLPATAAGNDVLEQCVAEGMAVTATVSFTVPQVVHIAEKYRCGALKAKARGIEPGKCFAVIMIGRLDDYLREVAQDNQARVSEEDIRQAGIAVTKRAWKIWQERAYEPYLLVAAFRGDYHLVEISGADMVMSIAPPWQQVFTTRDLPREERIDRPVSPEVIDRLMSMPEFVKAYEEDGMAPNDFVTYGPTQRTLTQFAEAGWKLLESFQ